MHTNRNALLMVAVAAAGCTSFEVSMNPPPKPLQPRPGAARPDLTISLDSTYAPYVGGQLDLDDLYPRDGRLGREERARYLQAFRATEQFRAVEVGAAGNGLHCHLTVVSGREPPDELLRSISLLLTVGLLPHRQSERVSLEARVSAPGRTPNTYTIDATVTTTAVDADSTRIRRPWTFWETEHEIVTALVARMAEAGWLASPEGT